MDDNLEKLRNLLQSEIASGKLVTSNDSPTCVHSLGVIKKKDNNKIRPKTDFSKPEWLSVNYHMGNINDRFRYNISVSVWKESGKQTISYVLGLGRPPLFLPA